MSTADNPDRRDVRLEDTAERWEKREGYLTRLTVGWPNSATSRTHLRAEELQDIVNAAADQYGIRPDNRFAEHLVSEAIGSRCELTSFAGSSRCSGKAVAIRWESGFADDVCQEHAETAIGRGAEVVFARRHDGSDER